MCRGGEVEDSPCCTSWTQLKFTSSQVKFIPMPWFCGKYDTCSRWTYARSYWVNVWDSLLHATEYLRNDIQVCCHIWQGNCTISQISPADIAQTSVNFWIWVHECSIYLHTKIAKQTVTNSNCRATSKVAFCTSPATSGAGWPGHPNFEMPYLGQFLSVLHVRYTVRKVFSRPFTSCKNIGKSGEFKIVITEIH